MSPRHNICHPRHVPTDEVLPGAESATPVSSPCAQNRVKLTAVIPSRYHRGMNPLTRARRGLVFQRAVVHHDVWDTVLCAGVPVSLRELVSLSLVQLKLADNATNQHKMLQCVWTLGSHVTATSSGVSSHYWCDNLRGDWIEIGGTEQCRGQRTSRLARVICGIKIQGIKRVFEHVEDDVWENLECKTRDYVVLILVRYATPHPDCGRERGPEYRPLCPGLLRNTHCLWKWIQRPVNFRRGCWRPRPWERHKHLFGATHEEQETRKAQEVRAWYDVIKSNNVVGHTNVTSDWDREECFIQSVMWA